jgi:hypothetical protein
MASSGITTYSVSELDVVTDAMGNIGAIGPGEALQAEDVEVCRRKLNMLVKQWVSQADFAPGLKMWTRRTAYLFLQQDQTEYTFGPSGDHASESYVTTTLSAAASAGASTITLTSPTGFAASMFIAVELNSGALQWTTINGALSGSTATLTAVLTGDAGLANRVFAYTSKPRKPFEIATAVLRDTDGNDTPVGFIPLEEYEAIGGKATEGTPCWIYFQPRTTDAKLYVYPEPDDVSNVIRMVYLSYVEDFTASSDTVDFPAEWFRALSAQLSLDIAPVFSRKITPDLLAMRDDALTMARNAHPVTSDSHYESAPDCY